MRKWLIVLTSIPLFFSSPLFAAPDSYYYVSGDAGIYQASFNNKYTDQTDSVAQNIAQSVQQNGYTAGLALGYRKLITPMYIIGAELSGNLDNHMATFQAGASTSAFTDQVQIKNHFNLVFVPGVKLSNFITAYLKLGLSLAAIQDSLNSPGGFGPTPIQTNSNQNTLGVTAGLQIEQMLTEKVSVFIEADYYDYAGVNFSNFQNFSATYSHSTHVYAYDTMMGVSYLFL